MFTRHYPVAGLKRTDDVIAFHLREAIHRNIRFLAGSERLQFCNWGPKDRVRREDHSSFHEILQLTNISRPAIPYQSIHRFCGNLVDALIHSLSVDSHKMAHELWNVLSTLP